MITCKICFAALAVIRDAESNAISAFNIMEGIGAAGLPFLVQNVSFFTLWERERDDVERFGGTFTLAIDDQELQRLQVEVNFQGNLKNRTIINVNGLVIPKPGSLRFRLRLEVGIEAEYSVDIAAPPPAVQVQP